MYNFISKDGSIISSLIYWMDQSILPVFIISQSILNHYSSSLLNQSINFRSNGYLFICCICFMYWRLINNCCLKSDRIPINRFSHFWIMMIFCRLVCVSKRLYSVHGTLLGSMFIMQHISVF